MKAMILPSVEQWEALEHGWLWLRAERVRERMTPMSGGILPVEWVPDDGTWHVPWETLEPHRRRERLVSPTIPENLLPKPCPECDGAGTVITGLRHGMKFVWGYCPSCGGSGLVAEPFLVGPPEVWRCRNARFDTGWQVNPDISGHWTEAMFWDHRQALLAEVRLTGQPIPVVRVGPDTPDGEAIEVLQAGTAWRVRVFNGRTAEVLEKLPWAQGLAVGDLLAEVAVEKLAEPVVDQACPVCRGNCNGGWRNAEGTYDPCPPECCDGDGRNCRGRVPFSLVPGTWGEL